MSNFTRKFRRDALHRKSPPAAQRKAARRFFRRRDEEARKVHAKRVTAL